MSATGCHTTHMPCLTCHAVDRRGLVCYKDFSVKVVPNQGAALVSCSERKKELRRRRHRRKKVSILGRKLEKATVSERTVIAEKLRSLTPGGDEIVGRWDLEKR